MVHSFNNCKCILSASGSSSSEIVDHGLHKKCNRPCCLDQCDFVSDRNYAILKQICTKIFKEYNRARCREKYTIFDGGNSVNVRIHRASSRGDINNIRNEKFPTENRHKLQNKNDYSHGAFNKVGEKNGFNADEQVFGRSEKYKLQNKNDYTSGQYNKGSNQFVRKPGRVGEKYGLNADDPVVGRSDVYKLQNKNDYTSGQYYKGGNQFVRKSGRVSEKYSEVEPDVGRGDRFKMKKKNDYTSGQFNKGDNTIFRKPGREVTEKFAFNADEPGFERSEKRDEQSKRNKTRKSKGKEAIEDDSFDDVNDKIIKKKSNIGGKKGDDYGYVDDDDKTKANRKNKKGFVNDTDSDETYNEKTGSKKQKSKKGDREKDENIKSRQRKEETEPSEMVKKKNKKLQKIYDEDSDDVYIYEKDAKKINKRIEKGIKPKGNKDDTVSYDGIEKDGKSNRNKITLGESGSDEVEKLDNRKSKKRGKLLGDGMKTNEKYHIINGLREKVRRGEKVSLDGQKHFRKKKKSKTSKYQNEEYFQLRKSKPTRVDEAKACDYLRAQMEERDLCKMCCLQTSTWSPNTFSPKLCIPSCCSKPVMPCF